MLIRVTVSRLIVPRDRSRSAERAREGAKLVGLIAEHLPGRIMNRLPIVILKEFLCFAHKIEAECADFAQHTERTNNLFEYLLMRLRARL